MPDDYDPIHDSRQSCADAVDAIRGHAYVRLDPDGPVIVAHRYSPNMGAGYEEFIVPITRNGLLILATQIINTLLKMGSR